MYSCEGTQSGAPMQVLARSGTVAKSPRQNKRFSVLLVAIIVAYLLFDSIMPVALRRPPNALTPLVFAKGAVIAQACLAPGKANSRHIRGRTSVPVRVFRRWFACQYWPVSTSRQVSQPWPHAQVSMQTA